MQRNVIIVVLIAVLLSVSGGTWFFYYGRGVTHEVVRTTEGYEPATLTIKKGDVVRFINQSDDFHWPASDLHPTHGIYPAFDPRRPVAVDEIWEFRFTEVGTWDFHDHLHAYEIGTIIVVE